MSEKKLDVQKVFEVIARIISAREGVEVTVTSVREKVTKEETA